MHTYTHRFIITLILIITFISNYNYNCQNTFKTRSKFNLGQNVTKVKFSPNYDTLVVLRKSDQSIYQYNPFTFELNGFFYTDSNTIPKDFQLFGNDIIVVTQQNQLNVYQRKAGSPQLVLKQNFPLKTNNSELIGIRLEKLNQDFDGNSTQTASRHIIVMFRKGFQVYKYVGISDNNKVSFLFNKNFDNPNQTLIDAQFFDQKFIVYALQAGPASSINLIMLNSTNTVKKVATKQAYSIKSYRAKTNTNYLAISYHTGVGQWKTQKSVNITQSKQTITTQISNAQIFFDSNRLIGFFNQTVILDFRTSDNFTASFPKYDQKMKQQYNSTAPKVTHVVVPSNNTGQLISNNCQQPVNCWNYYSLCDVNQYYVVSTIATIQTQKCTKCTGTPNCQKCYQNNCVKCLDSFFLNQTKKCQKCSDKQKGCIKCTQNGTDCYQCDKNNFYPQPVSGQCMCKSGTFWNQTSKQCISCQTKVQYCTMCLPTDNTNIKCYACDNTINRKIDNSTNKCVCAEFYYQNPTSKACELCDNFQKCTTCTNPQTCLTCNTKNHWALQPVEGKCACQNKYVQINNDCQICTLLGCLKCITQETCSQCEQGYVLDPIKKTCSCAQNAIFDQDTNSCKLCSDFIFGCYKCLGKDKCMICDSSKNRNSHPNDQGKCDCKPQYTQNDNNQCVLCTVVGCSNCQNQNICSTCIQQKGFTPQPQGGICKCKQSLYLQVDTCLSCSIPLVGCKSCQSKDSCDVCNSTASFQPKPINGSCKCINNNFVRDQQCVTCQRFCQHCQQCIESTSYAQLNILSEVSILTKTVYCLKCDDDFQLASNQCQAKGSNAIYFILGGSGLLAIIVVIAVVVWMKKRKANKLRDSRSKKQKDELLVSMILKQGSTEVISTDRKDYPKQKKNYQPLFNGNINYSISSQERISDKKSFNQSLKEYDREKEEAYNRKKQSGQQGSNYKDLNVNINKKKLSRKQIQQQEEKARKDNLFSRRKP